MKKTFAIILLFTVMFFHSYGQKSIKFKVIENKGNFIFPPHSNLRFTCKKPHSIRKSSRYQYIYLDNLKMASGNYYTVLNLLNKASYFSSKYAIDKIRFDTECYYGCDEETKGGSKTFFKKKIRKPNSKDIEKLKSKLNIQIVDENLELGSEICNITKCDSLNFCKIKYSYDQKAFLLQIDYEKIFSDNPDKEIQNLREKYDAKKVELSTKLLGADTETEKQVTKLISEITEKYEYDVSEVGITEMRFFELAKELIIEFNKREGAGTTDGFGWSTSISQNIVEKIFELIPIPSQSSLSRYLSQIDNEKSFVLLNPKIKLKVEAVEKVKDGSNWYFNLIGATIVTINRDNEGRIIQNPFHQFQVKGMPDNLVTTKVVLQSSSEDIQLSETLRESPFIFLWQNNFKQNNKASQSGGCPDSESDLINCNSQLWHFDKLNTFYTTDNDGTIDLDYNSVKYISSFGYRNLITPVIDISVNGNLFQYPLGLSLNQLKGQMGIPSSFKIYRFWNCKYIEIKKRNIDNLILLPNDKIIF